MSLKEEMAGPAVPEDATTVPRQDMAERTTRLGEIEVRRGETSTFKAPAPPAPGG